MVDGCWQEKGVPHVRTHDDRHTGPATTSAPTAAPAWTAPTARRESKDVRGAPGQCYTWMRHGCVSAASRDGTLLHAQAGRNPPLGSAVTGTPSIPIACRGAATALSGVASVDGATSHTQAPPPGIAKNTQSP